MIDVLHWSAYKINVILIIMLIKGKVLCDVVVGEFPVDVGPSVHDITEYFIEHNVTEKDARTAFRLHAHDLLNSLVQNNDFFWFPHSNLAFNIFFPFYNDRESASLVCTYPMQ